MKIYMSNIEDIKNVSALEQKLSAAEMIQYGKFSNNIRKLQYLLSHSIVKDVCGENIITGEKGVPTIKSGFVSIAHKDNLVVVAFSDKTVGIDIENTTIDRDFNAESELLKLPKPKDKMDFYKNFVKYESHIKFGNGAENANTYFYDKGDFLIGVCSFDSEQDIQFISFCAE